MNKKQYFRLTIVLMLPFAIISWWLSQQDFVIEKGKYIQCDLENNHCSNVISSPLKEIDSITSTIALQYPTKKLEWLLYFYNSNAPIQVSYFDPIKGEEAITTRVNWNTLESYGCKITYSYIHDFKKTYKYQCSTQDAMNTMPSELSTGTFYFINNDDSEKFEELALSAQNKFQQSEQIRITASIVFFLVIFILYFLISLIIRFIVYGFKKK